MEIQQKWKIDQRSTAKQMRQTERAELDERTNVLRQMRKVDTTTMTVAEHMAYLRTYQMALYRRRCITTRQERKHGIEFSHIQIVK